MNAKRANTSRLQVKVMQCFKWPFLGQMSYKKLKVKFQKISLVARSNTSKVFLPTPHSVNCHGGSLRDFQSRALQATKIFEVSHSIFKIAIGRLVA